MVLVVYALSYTVCRYIIYCMCVVWFGGYCVFVLVQCTKYVLIFWGQNSVPLLDFECLKLLNGTVTRDTLSEEGRCCDEFFYST